MILMRSLNFEFCVTVIARIERQEVLYDMSFLPVSPPVFAAIGLRLMLRKSSEENAASRYFK